MMMVMMLSMMAATRAPSGSRPGAGGAPVAGGLEMSEMSFWE
jgi:hypothetical protein